MKETSETFLPNKICVFAYFSDDNSKDSLRNIENWISNLTNSRQIIALCVFYLGKLQINSLTPHSYSFLEHLGCIFKNVNHKLEFDYCKWRK